MLLSKFNLAYWRNPGYNLVRIMMTFITSWIYAALYYEQGQVRVWLWLCARARACVCACVSKYPHDFRHLPGSRGAVA